MVLVLATAGCATGRPPVTWLEPVTDPPDPRRGARIFWFNRNWRVGACSLSAGSHVTLTWNDRAMVGLGLSATREGASFEYGITMLAADGTTLARFPRANGSAYVERNIPVGREHIRGMNVPITRDIYDRVARVLIHASC